MQPKSTSDPKVIKMFRKLEAFLDRELPGGKAALTFYNAETGRAFAVLLSPQTYHDVTEYTKDLENALDEAEELLLDAEEQIEILRGCASDEDDGVAQVLVLELREARRERDYWHQRVVDAQFAMEAPPEKVRIAFTSDAIRD